MNELSGTERRVSGEPLMRLLFDRVMAAVGLILCLPLFAVISATLVVDDGLPVLFRQMRVGRQGRLFSLLKFRSMFNGPKGALLTASGDRRVTRVGRILRKFKLDELPQLWNVLTGDMGLVGPRPEVPAFVEPGDTRWQTILSVRPGLTDLATLLYRDEERVLAKYSDPERAYRESILPSKLALNMEYLTKRTMLSDLKLLALTSVVSLVPSTFDPGRTRLLRRLVLSED